jgi:hypothetical protein
VYAGVRTKSQFGSPLAVQRFIVHPDFDHTTLTNDLAASASVLTSACFWMCWTAA